LHDRDGGDIGDVVETRHALSLRAKIASDKIRFNGGFVEREKDGTDCMIETVMTLATL